MRSSIVLIMLLLLSLAACERHISDSNQPVNGDYILKFAIGEELELPVNVVIEGGQIFVINGDERLAAVEKSFEDKTLSFRMPAFNNRFFLQQAGDGFGGKWHNYAKGDDYVIPVKLIPGTERFTGTSSSDISGNWKVTFSGGTDDEHIAEGVFRQNGSSVNGTFRTTTGDYRHLQGSVDDGMLRLSCFDGAHAFLFVAEIEGEALDGTFYSGIHWQEPWTAIRVEAYELPDPDGLTYVREGERFSFTFPDTSGKMVSFADFEGKPTIVQITGTWCPNCMDETVLLNDLYDRYHSEGLEIIALAYEPTSGFDEAVEYVERFRRDMNVRYEILVAGKAAKGEAINSLPMLNHIMSYPTTLFFDRQGQLLKIHTGFNGPGTGDVYTRFVAEITDLIENRML